MRTLSILLVLGLLLAPGLAAQGFVAPAHLTKFAIDPILSAPAIPGTTCNQIHMVPYPGKPGMFIVAITVNALTGGPGGYDFLSGVLDAGKNTFTADKLAVALNTTGTEFGMMYYHTGLLACYESNGSSTANQVRLATRTSLTGAWKDIGAVTNMPAQSYWDPSLANVGGVPHLLYMKERSGTTGQADIAMAPLNLTTLALDLSKEKVIIQTVTAAADANSATPIVDSTGELIAVTHHDQMNSNDHYLSMDLDPMTPSVLFITDPNWINNGGYAAGTFYDGGGASPYHVSKVETAWWTGGKAAIGTTMEISFYAPIKPVTVPPFSCMAMLSTGFLKTPMAIPSLVGQFGLNPAVLLPLAGGGMNPLTGQCMVKLPIPNSAVLKGAVVAGQAFFINPTGPQFIAGNTAALTIL